MSIERVWPLSDFATLIPSFAATVLPWWAIVVASLTIERLPLADTAPVGMSLTEPTCWAPSNAITSIERICFHAFGCVQASGIESVSPAAPVIVLVRPPSLPTKVLNSTVETVSEASTKAVSLPASPVMTSAPPPTELTKSSPLRPSMRSLPSPPNIVSWPSPPSSVTGNVAPWPKTLVAARRSSPKPPIRLMRAGALIARSVSPSLSMSTWPPKQAAVRGIGVGEPGALDVDDVAAGTDEHREQHAAFAGLGVQARAGREGPVCFANDDVLEVRGARDADPVDVRHVGRVG